MDIKIELWKALVLVVVASPVVNFVWFWVIRSFKRMPTDGKDYLTRLTHNG